MRTSIADNESSALKEIVRMTHKILSCFVAFSVDRVNT
jgi:hypothetical protein